MSTENTAENGAHSRRSGTRVNALKRQLRAKKKELAQLQQVLALFESHRQSCTQLQREVEQLELSKAEKNKTVESDHKIVEATAAPASSEVKNNNLRRHRRSLDDKGGNSLARGAVSDGEDVYTSSNVPNVLSHSSAAAYQPRRLRAPSPSIGRTSLSGLQIITEEDDGAGVGIVAEVQPSRKTSGKKPGGASLPESTLREMFQASQMQAQKKVEALPKLLRASSGGEGDELPPLPTPAEQEDTGFDGWSPRNRLRRKRYSGTFQVDQPVFVNRRYSSGQDFGIPLPTLPNPGASPRYRRLSSAASPRIGSSPRILYSNSPRSDRDGHITSVFGTPPVSHRSPRTGGLTRISGRSSGRSSSPTSPRLSHHSYGSPRRSSPVVIRPATARKSRQEGASACAPQMLYVIGLGLGDEKDITLRGLEAVKLSSKIFLEHYTSILSVGKERLEQFYGKTLILADRDLVESNADMILSPAKEEVVSFLVVGDPFGATTHLDLVLRAKDLGIKVEVIHNASIMNAIGCCGLQLYSFGQTVSIPFFAENWKPDSFYDKIAQNLAIGLHTLCLLDIKVKEQTVENLLKGNKIFEPPRFMTINVALDQLLQVEKEKKKHIIRNDTLCIALARIGTPSQTIVAACVEHLLEMDFGEPLHSLIVPGTMHVVESEFVNHFRR